MAGRFLSGAIVAVFVCSACYNYAMPEEGGEEPEAVGIEEPSRGEGSIVDEAPNSGETPNSGEEPTAGEMPNPGETPNPDETPNPGETPNQPEIPPSAGEPADIVGPRVAVDGRVTFRAPQGISVIWQVAQLTRPESGEGDVTVEAFERVENVATGVGPSLSFEVFKEDGEETVYEVRASDGQQVDAVAQVRVFEPDVRQSFVYEAPGASPINVYVLVPGSLSADSHLLFVMHGAGRNASEYISDWEDFSTLEDRIVVAPEFNRDAFPGSRSYNLGNVFSGNNCEGTTNPQDAWSFTMVEDLAKNILSGLKDRKLDIWGHSAGAQFVHRFMMFRLEAPVRLGIAANAGWYTAPDPTIECPYGTRDLAGSEPLISEAEARTYLRKNLVIMRGTQDVQRTDSLRQTPEADAQGRNRFERAAYMYSQVQQRAEALGVSTPVQLIDVPDADHDHSKMAPAAESILTDSGLSFR